MATHRREADLMAERLLELTRVGADAGQDSVLVNVDNVAWIESDAGGGARIVFAVGLQHERANGLPLTLLVGESIEQIRRMASVVGKTDDEAIAQAWADQTARRPLKEEAL
jgi:hypothetical protein